MYLEYIARRSVDCVLSMAYVSNLPNWDEDPVSNQTQRWVLISRIVRLGPPWINLLSTCSRACFRAVRRAINSSICLVFSQDASCFPKDCTVLLRVDLLHLSADKAACSRSPTCIVIDSRASFICEILMKLSIFFSFFAGDKIE
jgi:hypothetical protein